MRNSPLYLIFTLFFLILFSESCRKEDFYAGDSGVEFSTDTVMFDTVFTKLGSSQNPRSANKRFTVRNTQGQTIKTSIYLAGGNASAYRINVDGLPVSSIENYEIRANDSIYVFVEVTVDPNNTSNPLIIQDSIVFRTNGKTQDVKLVAWGQDAHYFDGEVLPQFTVWADKTKPYVIFNSVLVPKNGSLTIQEGVNVYSAVNSMLQVEGTLKINGTSSSPVTFQGARLERDFDNTPGQWWGIRLFSPSKNNEIRYAEIKNAIIGIQVDSLQVGSGVKLKLENTRIKNMSAAGLVGYTATITATNVLIANCGQYTFLGELGGDYTLLHCTFANYNTTFSRQKPAFGLANSDYKDVNGTVFSNNLRYDIRNCIVWGSLKEELVFSESGSGSVTKYIGNTILKTESNTWNQNSNKLNLDPVFKDYKNLNFELDTLSPAKDAGAVSLVTTDLKGELRDALPDIGCFERKE